MINYNSFNIRTSVAAAICSLLFTTTVILAVSTPVVAADRLPTPSAVIAPLA